MPEKFIADAMLGRLAKWLRILGYDALYQPFYGPGQIHSFVKDGRVLLTRNPKWQNRFEGVVLLRSDHVKEQLEQLLGEGIITVETAVWFTRCMLCNEPLLAAPPEAARENVPEYVFFSNTSGIRFCPSCKRFFWPGSHRKNMVAQLHSWGF